MRLAIPLLILLALAACAQQAITTNIPDDAVPCEEPRPEVCTMEYLPVCGSDNATYGNRCEACSNEEVDWYVNGTCDMTPEEPEFPDESIFCDAATPCPADLECWSIEGGEPQCTDPDPALWYCQPGEAIVLESDPPQLRCQQKYLLCDTEGCEKLDECPEGYDIYGSQLGPACVMHYEREDIESWEECNSAQMCTGTCGLADQTTEGVPIERAEFRCLPPDYSNFLLHTSGMTMLDENGQQSTVIA